MSIKIIKARKMEIVINNNKNQKGHILIIVGDKHKSHSSETSTRLSIYHFII